MIGKRLSFLSLALILIWDFVLTPGILQAQTNTTLISIAIPEYMGNELKPDLFTQFETEHPGVKVILNKTGNDGYYPPAAYSEEAFTAGAAKYVNSADVLYVSNYNISEEATRAGYFLDLAPLVINDTTLNPDDFIPAVWQSYQWNKGIWALPASVDIFVVNYDPTAFDKAGLAYPNEKWALADFANAVRKLTQRSADGKVTVPGSLLYNPAALFRSVAGKGFYDPAVLPNPPLFDTPELVALLETLSAINAEGITGNDFRGNYTEVPLRIDQSYALATPYGEEKPRKGSLLPGGKAGLVVNAFAVSGGTRYPDLAYALAKFLTSDPKVGSIFYGTRPARKSVVAAPRSYDTKFTPENQAVIDQAYANALPVSELRYNDYISKALSEMTDKKLDAKSALQAQQANATKILAAIMEKRPSLNLAVATIVPTPVLKSGELTLNFNFTAYVSPLPNRELWDKVIKDFVSRDPQVRQIVMDSGFGSDMKETIAKYDCFAYPANITSYLDTANLLDIAPLMAADSSFDKKDAIGNTLTQLEQNNKILGFPLYLQPQILRYNSDMFAKAGISMPESGWNTAEFSDALKALKVAPGDPAPFIPAQYGGTYLLMLIAAYGGLPLDYRTTPATVNFTDAANVDAIRQVLDLAKKGYIKYQKLAANGGSFGGMSNTEPVYTDSMSLLSFRRSSGDAKDPYKIALYPKGSKYVPLAYDLGVAYISAKTQYPDACWRWITTISKHPELFSAMPAWQSAIDSPAAAAQGADVVAFYKQLAALTRDPSTILMQAQATSISPYILQYVLNRAFDRYVLEDADLENELKAAQDFVKGYETCSAGFSLSIPTKQEEQLAYAKQFTDCATKVDPTLKSAFGQN